MPRSGAGRRRGGGGGTARRSNCCGRPGLPDAACLFGARPLPQWASAACCTTPQRTAAATGAAVARGSLEAPRAACPRAPRSTEPRSPVTPRARVDTWRRYSDPLPGRKSRYGVDSAPAATCTTPWRRARGASAAPCRARRAPGHPCTERARRAALAPASGPRPGCLSAPSRLLGSQPPAALRPGGQLPESPVYPNGFWSCLEGSDSSSSLHQPTRCAGSEK